MFWRLESSRAYKNLRPPRAEKKKKNIDSINKGLKFILLHTWILPPGCFPMHLKRT